MNTFVLLAIAAAVAGLAAAGFAMGKRMATRRYRRELAQATSEFQAVFQALPDLYFRVDNAGVILDYNAGRSSDLYVPPEQFLGRTFADVLPKSIARILRRGISRAHTSGSLTVVEYPLTLGADKKYFEARMLPFMSDQTFMVVRDITARRSAEESLRATLAEKEILIKEIQHRVKNNLQLMASLLDLQSDAINDARALELLRESQNRLRSIALIHEQLYESPDLGRVDFAVYAQSLVSNVFRSYGVRGDRIAFGLAVSDFQPTLDTAMSCGLIVCELVSNGLKHAFPEGRKGLIRIGLYRAGTDMVLSVADDGVGFDKGTPPSSLGLQIVETLTKQLGGRIEFCSTPGVEVKISFPASLEAPHGSRTDPRS